MNNQVENFFNADFSDLEMPLIAVFFDPKDVPGKYVARVFDLGKPTDMMTIKDTLEEIRAAIPPVFNRIPRTAEDHPTVVEVWL